MAWVLPSWLRLGITVGILRLVDSRGAEVDEGFLWEEHQHVKMSAFGAGCQYVSESWCFPTRGQVAAQSSRGGDSTCFGSFDGNIYSVDDSGVEMWRFNGQARFTAPPLSDESGNVYIGSHNGTFFALSPKGVLRWKFEAGSKVTSGATLVRDADGKSAVVFGSWAGNVYALATDDGQLKWTLRLKSSVASDFTSPNDKDVYFGTYDHTLFRVSLAGEVVWRVGFGGPITAPPAVDDEGLTYVGTWDKKVYAVDALGNISWTFQTNGIVESTPAITRKNVYFDSQDGTLYSALKVDGSLNWKFATNEKIRTSPVVDGDVIVIGAGRTICGLDLETGNQIWKFKTISPVLYVSIARGHIFAAVDQSVCRYDPSDKEHQTILGSRLQTSMFQQASQADLVWSQPSHLMVLGGIVLVLAIIVIFVVRRVTRKGRKILLEAGNGGSLRRNAEVKEPPKTKSTPATIPENSPPKALARVLGKASHEKTRETPDRECPEIVDIFEMGKNISRSGTTTPAGISGSLGGSPIIVSIQADKGQSISPMPVVEAELELRSPAALTLHDALDLVDGGGNTLRKRSPVYSEEL